MARKPTKYIYWRIIQSHWGYGWEDVCAEEDPKEARDRLREYRENQPEIAHRLITRRELREATP